MRYAEHEAQKAVCLWWKCQHKALGVRAENLLYAVPNGQKRTARQGAWLKAEGLRAGCPDLILDVPRGPYHGMRIEMKSAAGTAGPLQKQWQLDLIAQGYHAVICKGWEAATRAISDYLKLPDEMKGAA
jgi:hypothetical protein